MSLSVQEIQNKILPILKGEGVVRSSIFGSFARGESVQESDIDILVELPEGKSLLDLVGLQLKLEEILNVKVDLLTYRSIYPLLKDKILKEAIPIL